MKFVRQQQNRQLELYNIVFCVSMEFLSIIFSVNYCIIFTLPGKERMENIFVSYYKKNPVLGKRLDAPD